MDDPYNYDEANSANLKRNPVPELPKWPSIWKIISSRI